MARRAEGFDEDIAAALARFDGAEFERSAFVRDLSDGGGEAGGNIAWQEMSELEARAAFAQSSILGRVSKAVEDIHLVVQHEASAGEAREDTIYK